MEASKQYHGSMQAAELWNYASSRTMEACKQQNYGSMQAADHELPSRDVSSALQYDRLSSAGCRTANDHVSWSARSGPVRILSPYHP